MSNEPDKIIYSMIRVSKRHGQKEVLKDISLSYFYGAKIGVLGLNGAGKSSLLKILAGVDQSFDGKTVLAPGYTIGYLEQEPLQGESRTVREVVEEGVAELMAIAREFEAINAKFAEPMEPEEMDALIARQAEVHKNGRKHSGNPLNYAEMSEEHYSKRYCHSDFYHPPSSLLS